MKATFFYTNNSWSPTILRLLLGLVLLGHGTQKLFGWLGGYGFEGTMNFFTQSVGLPWVIGFLVIIIEFFGALALIFGFATRIVSIGLIALFAGIVFTGHLDHGFFMNWNGQQKGEGYEYHLLVIGMALSLLVSGAGKWSADYAIQKKA